MSYAEQNPTQPHSSISLDHIPDSTGHPLALGGLADQEDPSHLKHQEFISQQTENFNHNSSQGKEVKDDIVRGHDEWMIQLLKYFGCSSSESSAALLERLFYQLSQAWTKAIIQSDLSTKVNYEWVKKKSCRKKTMIGGTYFNNYRKLGFLVIETYEERRRHWVVKISPGKMLLYILQNEQLCHNKKLKKMSANLRSALLKLPELTRPKIGLIIEQDLTLLEREIIKFIFCREWKNKSVTKNKKSVTKTSTEEKKAVSGSEPCSATSEHSQDRVALKSNEATGKTEPLSETPTKSTERQEVKKEKFSQPSKRQASRSPEIKKAEENLNSLAEAAYEEFLVLFKPEEDKRFQCYRSDFLRLMKARVKSHLGCAKDIKTYMRKFSLNQYLMGKRLGGNGKFFHTSLYALLSTKIIDDYHEGEYSRYFTPYNELDLSQQKEASVPQNMLEKLNLSQEQLETVCAVVNEHLQHSEAKLLDNSALLLTPEHMQKLMADRPVTVDPIPSESIEKAGEEKKRGNHTQDEETSLGDVSSPFDEAVKKHLLKVLPYNTYKAWMIDAKASFEETEFGWKVTAQGKYSQTHIELKFRQFIDEAQRNYSSQKTEGSDKKKTSPEPDSSQEPLFDVLESQANLLSLQVFPEVHEDGSVARPQKVQESLSKEPESSQEPRFDGLEEQANLPSLQAFPELMVGDNVIDDRQKKNRTILEEGQNDAPLRTDLNFDVSKQSFGESDPKEIEKTLPAEIKGRKLQQPIVFHHYSESLRRTLHAFIVLGILSGWGHAVEIKRYFTPQQQCLPLIICERQNAPSEILRQRLLSHVQTSLQGGAPPPDRGVNVNMLIDPLQKGNIHFQNGKTQIFLRPPVMGGQGP